MPPPTQAPGLDPAAKAALKRQLGYLRDHKGAAVLALVSTFLVMAANLLAPLLVRAAVDDGVAKGDVHALQLIIGGLLLAAVVRGVFGFLQGYVGERASQHIAFQLRGDLFAKMQRLSFSYYDQAEAGQLLTRLTNDVEAVRAFVAQGLLNLAQSLAMLLFTAIVLVSLDPILAVMVLIVVGPIAVVLGRFTKLIGPLFGKMMMFQGRLASTLREALSAVRLVRAYGRQAHESARYDATNGTIRDIGIEFTVASSGTFPLIGLFAGAGTMLIVGVGGWEVMTGRLSVGTLLAFTSYLGMLIQPLMGLGFAAMGVTRAGVSAGRIAEIFDAPLDVTDKPGAQALPPLTGAIAFEDVSFRYPGAEKDVLTGVSFEARPGETIAVVGMTGSGKSTLAHLLPRFYDVTGGRVLVDGHDVRDVTLGSLRSQIGIVLQSPLLFGGTIGENIAYGRPDAPPEAIEAAARAARAADFIADLPEGYRTPVGERGVGLSGGQRQRVAIARALLVDPRLIILDDSTSAVDTETEAAIQASLDSLMGDGRTCLVIAQRFSTVRDADRILVLDGGRLVAQGTHHELMKTSPLYQDIVGTQLAGAKR